MESAAPDTLKLKRAIAGDHDALASLLAIYGPQVQSQVAARIDPALRAHVDAEDVLQVSYLEAFLRISGLEDRGLDSFRSWLTTLALNNLRDALRALGRQKRIPPALQMAVGGSATDAVLLDELAQTSATASRAYSKKEALGLVRAELDRLPPDYATVISQIYLHGCSIDAVAELMGRSAGSIYMLRARAIDLLRERLLTVFESQRGGA